MIIAEVQQGSGAGPRAFDPSGRSSPAVLSVPSGTYGYLSKLISEIHSQNPSESRLGLRKLALS